MPSHGKIVQVEHEGQIWKVTLSRKVEPTYTVWMDNQMFVALYNGVTLRDFATDYLYGGDEFIRGVLVMKQVRTVD